MQKYNNYLYQANSLTLYNKKAAAFTSNRLNKPIINNLKLELRTNIQILVQKYKNFVKTPKILTSF